MDYAIYRFRNSISFWAANSTLSPSWCPRHPCFIGYSEGNELQLEQPAFDPARFANWCERVLNPYAYRLVFPAQVREVLAGNDPVLLGVGLSDRPPEIGENVKFFLVEENAIESFVENVSQGLYVYRPKDRQFVKFRGDFEAESRTLLFSGVDDYRKREFIAGYYPGENDSMTEMEIELLNEIAEGFGDRVSFVILQKKEARELLWNSRWADVDPGSLFVVRSVNVSAGRWILQAEEAHARDVVVGFLAAVLNGTRDCSLLYSVVADDPLEVHLREVNSLTVEKAVITRDDATLLLLTAEWCDHCKQFKPQVRQAAEILAGRKVKFYWMNEPKNDLPECIPDHPGMPALFLWPAGENYTRPLMYERSPDYRTLLAWIAANSGFPGFTIHGRGESNA
jgi:thiol-disulfide isomerase/thioredoxin